MRAINRLRRAASGRRHVFDLENGEGTPIYVHAKICVEDDVWFTIGSDSFNRRSWTTDSELTCAVLDSTPADTSHHPDDTSPRLLAQELRHSLWSEHLGLPSDDPRLDRLDEGPVLWTETARDLDDWHASGGAGPRPAGRIRRHRTEPITRLQRLRADPAYRLAIDPDHRPRRLRAEKRF